MSGASSGIDHTHDPAASSWVPGADEHAAFPLQNLPLGVFSTGSRSKRIGTAISDHVFDLRSAAEAGLLPTDLVDAMQRETLNALFALPPDQRRALRHAVFGLLASSANRARAESHLHRLQDCTLHLPATIGDYTDFYVGIHHATNIGRQFRPDQPLLPNYKHIPIGYHGRASSIRPSGIPVRRPSGQRKAPDADAPTFGPSTRLDYELELGVWIAGENELGSPVPIDTAAERIAGLCLLNDWSARDLQAWEYQPLGPFLSKNFHTTISPWVVTNDALAPFRMAQPRRPSGDPQPLPYLWSEADQARGAYALTLEAWLQSAQMRERGHDPIRLSAGPASHMYWTVAQMITHHTANGCNLQPGDLLGTGTISGPDLTSCGSLMEITRGGTEPLKLPTGETRRFLEDGDAVSFTATATAPGTRAIGFGGCRATVSAAQR